MPVSRLRRPATILALLGAVCLGGGVAAPDASADQLSVEQLEDERGYTAVEELSYETIIDASDGYSATLRIRTALRNTSRSTRDSVLAMALPRNAELQAISVAKDGQWSTGTVTVAHAEAARRDPGAVFARQLAPSRSGQLPAAEVVAFGLGGGDTIQVELTVNVYPRLRGDRWELDLPSRGLAQLELSPERRVLVKGLRKGEPFAVDDIGNRGKPYLVTSGQDGVTVSWPAHLNSTELVEGRFEVMPGPPGFDDGEFRAYLRLGVTAAPRPDHVVLMVDRSLSTSKGMQRETRRFAERLLGALPSSATFDAVGFARDTTPLLGPDAVAAKVGDAKSRRVLMGALDRNERGQGTDLVVAMEEAARRARRRGSKRPMIVVVTDGMLPISLEPAKVASHFQKAWGKRRASPEILFVVDDPLLMRSGLSPSHPVSRVAAALGARISLETLANLGHDGGLEVLASPRVMGKLELELPENATLRDQVPEGLVAGNFALLRGSYVGDQIREVKVRGSFAGKKVERTLTAHVQARLPNAIVAVTSGDLGQAATEGFVRPPWYALDEQRAARQSIDQAGRGGVERKGRLDRKIFRYYLTTRVLPRSRVCYNHALSRSPTQSGRVMLKMEIGKGEVMHASVSSPDFATKDDKLVACLEEAAWALDVPAGKLDDKVYMLSYPLRLSPPEGGEAAVVEGISDEMMELLLGSPNDPTVLAHPAN
ncbi:MAG: VWA domain-containing protein [Myxococcota bacterium]